MSVLGQSDAKLSALSIDGLAQAIAVDPIDAMPLADRRFLASRHRKLIGTQRSTLTHANERHDKLFFILTGQLELATTYGDGEELLVAMFGPGNWISWIEVFDTAPATHDLILTPGAILYEFQGADVRAALHRNPQLYPQIIRYIGARVRNLMAWQRGLGDTRRDKRLAAVLVLLSSTSRHHPEVHEVRMSQSRLARMIGCSRDRLDIELRKLAQAGLLDKTYKCITLGDLDALKHYADS